MRYDLELIDRNFPTILSTIGWKLTRNNAQNILALWMEHGRISERNFLPVMHRHVDEIDWEAGGAARIFKQRSEQGTSAVLKILHDLAVGQLRNWNFEAKGSE